MLRKVRADYLFFSDTTLRFEVKAVSSRHAGAAAAPASGGHRGRHPGPADPRSTRRMFESDARDPLAETPVVPAAGGIEDDEPPSPKRRHPVWQDVPDHLWDDWRWQTQNAVRSVRQLRHLLPFSPEELEAIGRLEGDYKLAIPHVDWVRSCTSVPLPLPRRPYYPYLTVLLASAEN